MSDKGKKKEEESGGEVGLWYVSFADMITLLLSFFVMLTTFSSYSKEDLSKFSGIWAQMADYSVFAGKHGNEGLAPPAERPVDPTMAGSEKPTGAENHVVESTGESDWLSSAADAYNNRRVLRVSASRLFWGMGTQGTLLTPAGRAHLKKLCVFIRQVPCQVLIGNSISSGVLSKSKGQELDRPYAVMEYMRTDGKVPPERLALTMAGPEMADAADDEGIIEITLLSGGVAR